MDVNRIRGDFPILSRIEHGRPIVYLDSAATSQKPTAVLQAEEQYYAHSNANVHRGVYALSVEATDAYEAARARVARFRTPGTPPRSSSCAGRRRRSTSSLPASGARPSARGTGSSRP